MLGGGCGVGIKESELEHFWPESVDKNISHSDLTYYNHFSRCISVPCEGGPELTFRGKFLLICGTYLLLWELLREAISNK